MKILIILLKKNKNLFNFKIAKCLKTILKKDNGKGNKIFKANDSNDSYNKLSWEFWYTVQNADVKYQVINRKTYPIIMK